MKNAVALLLAVLGLLTAGPSRADDPGPRSRPLRVGMGNPDALRAAYRQWRSQGARPESVVLPLAWSKALSSEHTAARGQVVIDLAKGRVSAQVEGLPSSELLDVWFVENRPAPGHSVAIEEGDRVVRLGRMYPLLGRATLEADIPPELLGNFDLDLVVVARASRGVREGGLLYGTPDLFQRLYSRDLRAAQGPRSARVSGVLLSTAPGRLSDEGDSADLELESLVADGEDLFFNATFGGNGRTCGTCHPAENNLTLDPAFIATLPASDPLFIAENRPNPPFPDLVFELNGGRRFENPVLMRQHALIVENLDGFDDLANRFTMRSVPHVFAQTVSIERPPGGLSPPVDRTGWSGDGAPNSGSLRDFSTGAVVQHAPRSLNREPGVDFVLPTPGELTAMEAFMRSLGRQTELDLSTLALRDAEATAGQVLFQDNAVSACNVCHFNAGANANPAIFGPAPGNRNFNTGVEFFMVNHPDGTGEPRPIDGGFGTNPQGNFTSIAPNIGNPRRPNGGFGDGSFNTTSLVEFADTLPAFHNNITSISAGLGATPDLPDTVEGAVEFYTRPEFAQGAGVAITLSATQIAQLGKFLRVINALENRRLADEYAGRARLALSSPPFDDHAVNRLLRLAIADSGDGIEVLEAVGLHPRAQQRFRQAQQQLKGAMSGPTHERLKKIEQARERLRDARADMEVVP